MTKTTQLPFTIGRVHEKEFVDQVYGQFITWRLIPAKPTAYARAVARGEYPQPPEGADLDTEMTPEEVEALTGFPVYSRRAYFDQFGMSNSPVANGTLRPPRAA